MDGSVTLHTRQDAEGSFGLVGFGADYLVSNEFLAGVALYLDYMRDIGTDGEITGNGALIGPYVSLGIAEGLTLDASLFYGRSWNDASATVFGDSYSGSFETERLIARMEIEGEWLFEQLTVRPSATLYLANETAQTYSVSNGAGSVAVDGFSTTTVQLGTGLRMERSFALDSGLDLTPQFGIRAGLGGSGEDLGLDSGFGGMTAGMTLAGPGWSLRGVADFGLDTTGLAAGSIRAELSGSF